MGLSRGFTKGEWITVTAIVLSLGLLANYQFNLAKSKARDFERKDHIKGVATALEDYLTDNSAYPPTTDGWRLGGCGDVVCPVEDGEGIMCKWDNKEVPNDLTCGDYIYLQPIPRAPDNPQQVGRLAYRYLRLEKQKMALEACLELRFDVEATEVKKSLTGFDKDNCKSGVIFQFIR